MRRQAVALGLTGALAISTLPSALQAQTPPTPIVAAGQGVVKGVATDAKSVPMKVTMQLRDASNNIVSVVGTNDVGTFAIAANPGNYTLVMVDSAGNVIGASGVISVTAGATVSVTVSASALVAAASGAAAGVAAAGGAATGTSLATVGIAVGAGAAALTVATVVASSSR